MHMDLSSFPFLKHFGFFTVWIFCNCIPFCLFLSECSNCRGKLGAYVVLYLHKVTQPNHDWLFSFLTMSVFTLLSLGGGEEGEGLICLMASQSFCMQLHDRSNYFTVTLTGALPCDTRSLCFCIIWFVLFMVSSTPVLQVVLFLGGPWINCSDALCFSSAWLWNSGPAYALQPQGCSQSGWECQSFPQVLLTPASSSPPSSVPREQPSQSCCWSKSAAFICRGKERVTSLVLQILI